MTVYVCMYQCTTYKAATNVIHGRTIDGLEILITNSLSPGVYLKDRPTDYTYSHMQVQVAS